MHLRIEPGNPFDRKPCHNLARSIELFAIYVFFAKFRWNCCQYAWPAVAHGTNPAGLGRIHDPPDTFASGRLAALRMEGDLSMFSRSRTVAPAQEAVPSVRRPERKLWTVAAFFFDSTGSSWLDDLIEDNEIVFRKVMPLRKSRSWHRKRSRLDSLKVWAGHLGQAARALSYRPEGVVTVFPQIAMCAGLLKRLGPVRPYIVAYTFNLGSLSSGRRQQVARFIAPAIDLFVVHSPTEVAPYAAYFGLPESRFRFVPLQRGAPGIVREEEADAPFILAMGSAHRDYETLIAAVDRLGIPTIIVTRADAAAALPRSPHVTLKSDLSQEECLALLARARISVTPVGNLETASGQITFVNAMRLGVPVVATRCPGTEGYVEDGETGLLVPPFDSDAMADAIAALWNDRDRRDGLSKQARETADRRFSDAAAAEMLHELVNQVRGRGRANA
ncbi:glycosyltransferase family 4 protein [Palleronia sp. LCG004]|uniref:glycosyltransferase family 4 protein n=1 Tax=Palleronia sp. LCG004 TaxID=3079304 RepID=UPI0029434B30|nr:glycosyltransferase family 4 protein [Palleronia sp. LCG004]WOI58405.1 glycosyltransferase family 4 protein [Palleronia sp. LCG004]